MTPGQPLRILHVTRIPRTVTAFLMPLLRRHRERGEDVRVACGEGSEIPAIEGAGFRVHRFRLERNLSPVNVLRALNDLVRIVRRERVDWVFTHTPIASGIARLAAWLGRARGTIYMAHGLPCAPQIPRWEWLLWYLAERIAGQLTRGLITVNRYDFDLARRHHFVRRVGNVFRVNEVGVDTARMEHLVVQTDVSEVRRELGIAPDKRVILMLARTVATKGVREFLVAARGLLAEGVPACFVFAGSGPLDEEIAGFVRERCPDGGVYFLGWRRDAHRILAACDVFVLPTYYPEGLPVSILEAMACGKPVVVTRHRGCEDAVIDAVTGILVEPRAIEPLAAAIRRLVEHPEVALRLGESGRRRLQEGFRSDQCTAAIFDAFDHIIGADR